MEYQFHFIYLQLKIYLSLLKAIILTLGLTSSILVQPWVAMKEEFILNLMPRLLKKCKYIKEKS